MLGSYLTVTNLRYGRRQLTRSGLPHRQDGRLTAENSSHGSRPQPIRGLRLALAGVSIMTLFLLTHAVVRLALAGARLDSLTLPDPAQLVAATIASMALPVVQSMLKPGSIVDRYQPCRSHEALVRLVRQLSESPVVDDLLTNMAREVAATLKLSYVRIELLNGATGTPLVSVWGCDAGELLRLPLTYQSETIGSLTLARGRGGAGFTGPERALAAEIGRELAVAAHVLRVTRRLRRAHRELLVAREEERRRLRRDLHDGLGPVLATVSMRIDAIRAVRQPDAETLDVMLGQLRADTQSAIANIRWLIDELRSPMVTGLGLQCALRYEVDRFEEASGGRLKVMAVLPPDLQKLPARVELAAYYIASEALTNVARHARASRCEVRLTVGAQILLEIVDDGIGIPESPRTGLGLISIRERARELGGECVIRQRRPHGTIVSARIPLS